MDVIFQQRSKGCVWILACGVEGESGFLKWENMGEDAKVFKA